jgi:hypothetical protein
MKDIFLVNFKYDYYCQGTESTYVSVLVKHVQSFEEACNKIINYGTWDNPREFENLTI